MINSEDKEKLYKKILNILISAGFFLYFLIFCFVMDYSLVLPMIFLFIGIHLYYTRRVNFRLFLCLGLLLSLLIIGANLLIAHADISYNYIPVSCIAILTMLLFNDIQITFLMSFLSSILVGVIFGGDFSMMITFFVGSLMGAYTVKDARTRGQLISAGLFVSAMHIVCLFLIHNNLDLFLNREFTAFYLYPLAANGLISALIVIATLKFFEIFFGVVTNFSLLELSDFNQPILKRMILEAPGTYHHSLVVSNLAEAAANEIGANSLLARVGAYYHDIGKLTKTEYFTENQIMGSNKHDNIEPSMSRLVILNHVKEGMEIAKKYKLNPVITDFITQHHGTSLMYYFHKKALEEAEDTEEIKEENFRYPGPRPQTKETAILLMADSVEAATRSLDEPTPTNIEETVKKVINNKFIDGQLDDCNLTLKEIDKISSMFTRVLSATYHGRVKYPEKKNGNNNKKLAEKSSSQPLPNNQDNKESSSS